METLQAVLVNHLNNHPDKTAVVDAISDVRLSYSELSQRVEGLGKALQCAGVAPGDRILWLGQNNFKVQELILACSKIHAILCPVNWRQSVDELKFVIEELQPKVIVWQSESLALEVKQLRQTFREEGILWLQHDTSSGDENGYESFLSQNNSPISRDVNSDCGREASLNIPLMIVYTAAFDGWPKGAMLSEEGVLAQASCYAGMRGFSKEDIYLASGPLFHVNTLLETMSIFFVGGTNVFVPRSDPQLVCEMIASEKCSKAFLVEPTLSNILSANLPEQYNLSSLISVPGSKEWNEVITVDESPWGKNPFGYGQTETFGYATYSQLSGKGGMGCASPLMEVLVVDEQGNELPEGEVGEMLVKGKNLMQGYWQGEACLAQPPIPGHRSGDLGRKHSDGSIDFVGPKQRMIRSAQENIYPIEVELCLRRHPCIEDVAVIGVPDKKWNQSVKALVVLKEWVSLTENDVQIFCRSHIASYKKPRVVEFVESIPRLSGRNGAIDYDAVDAQYGGGGYPGVRI